MHLTQVPDTVKLLQIKMVHFSLTENFTQCVHHNIKFTTKGLTGNVYVLVG